MDTIHQSIRKLEALLLPNISPQEDKQIRAEIEILREERKKLDSHEAQIRMGISLYGSYFSSMTNQ
jgi:hypothetical protein